MSSNLESARDAFADQRWTDARRGFLEARSQGRLTAEDLAALAEALWWEGAIEECLETYEEAYRLFRVNAEPDEGEADRRAAMVAMDVGIFWSLRGETAIGSGWFSRAERLLEDQADCVERSYLASLAIDEALGTGEFERAADLARQVIAEARRFDDDTLLATATIGEGIARIKQGRVADGMRIVDEAMLPVVEGRVRAVYAGNVYCQLMGVCHELGDLRRAEQWTDATSRWSDRFDRAVMFSGMCRMHRAQLLQIRGRWPEAEEEATFVCTELASMNTSAVALAHYELGQIRRMRGDLAGADEAYSAARRLGCDPQPGWALLHLARGERQSALAQVEAALSASSRDMLAQADLLFAQVEISLAIGRLDTARAAAEDLDQIARCYASSGLVAAARHASGAVMLAAGDLVDATGSLADALARWHQLDAPYRCAQARMLLARAHIGRGNDEAAKLERDEARATFHRLGAPPDIAVVEPSPVRHARPGGLTPREVEVLALVAQGHSNKDVAEALVLSEKTIARHLSNIYAKLALSSRTAAAAYAFEYGLVSSPPA